MVKVMGIGSARRERRKSRETDSQWEGVIRRMDELVGVRVGTLEIEKRIGALGGERGELSAKEAESLPLAAEYSARLHDALNSGSIRKLDRVE
jgi:hypothetical protein